MTTPLLEVIRRNYPEASITYVAGSWSKVIAEHHPAITHVIDSGSVGIPGHYRLSAYLALARLLRKQHFDLAFVLDRSPVLTLLPWLAGIPRRIGLDSLGRGFSLTDRVPVSASPAQLQHQADIYLDLARTIGLHLDHPQMHFVPADEERQAVQALLPAPSQPKVALLIGGGSNPGMQLTAKRWPLERYRELVSRLVTEYNAQVVLIGGSDDAALNQSLIDGLTLVGAKTGAINRAPTVFNLAGKTSFGQTAALLEQCVLFIGNDSSPMHLAAAVGIPVIAIFGPTSPQEYGPYPPDDPKHIALWRNPHGRPCFFLGRMQSCIDCTCMQNVTVADVWEAVQHLLPIQPIGETSS